MWIVIVISALCLVAGLAFGVVVTSAESRANRMERRARDIVVWSVERVAGASMRAIAAGRVGWNHRSRSAPGPINHSGRNLTCISWSG